jgi:hypothetical protein
MKKSNNKTGKKNEHENAITATFTEPWRLQNMVEKLAYRGCDIGYSLESVPVGWHALDSSSVEAYVSGDMIFSNENDFINIPFVSCFLFTCIKKKRGEYKLFWSSSLS